MKVKTILLFLPIFSSLSLCQDVAIRESTLLISTLDGTFHAVGQKSGIVKWSFNESPILKLPSIDNYTAKVTKKLFLPDPKDGALYLYNGISNHDDGSNEALEKLPFTISELVSASPCRSSDGLLYTGKKTDEWITIDVRTGEKVDVLNSDTPMCPSPSSTSVEERNNLLYLGKTEYHISIFDLKTKEKTWNLSLIDYSSSASGSIPQSAYDLLHLTSSTSGRIATIDISGDINKLLWTHQFSSPVVGIFQFNEGIYPIIRRIPFSTIGGPVSPKNIQHHNPLFPSLYIGEIEDKHSSSKSIYALSTLVDLTQTVLISTKKKPNIPRIEGPGDHHESNLKSSLEEFFNILVLGYYEYPQISTKSLIHQFQIAQKPQDNLLTAEEKPLLPVDRIIPVKITKNQTESELLGQTDYNLFWFFIFGFGSFTSSILIAIILHIFFRNRTSNINKPKSDDSNISESSVSSSTSPLSSSDQTVTIGKIVYNSKEIIGRGCSGTCVYKGLYEEKLPIAVKRIISDCFVLADHEIELLRSFQHPHLIRYFATETDKMFKYIAIELAELTLADYIESSVKNSFNLNEIQLLEQASKGLAHLHSLNVIHRDIKPQNILISFALPPNGDRKIMISDFGVSKILTENDFSEVSTTLKGTEGWIAPEVLKSKLDRIVFKASKPIDIFSLGCLFYYVFTNGQHPFGDLVHRQSNILRGEYNLDKIKDEESICKYNLILAMINPNSSNRPTIDAVIKHPLFWDANRSLQFLEDVSDRIEKETYSAEVLRILERGQLDVTKGNWFQHISVQLKTDLEKNKHRSYKPTSVRDLLRVIRNKKHHYRELTEDLQKELGGTPEQFFNYFIAKFPRLIVHAYIAMQHCKNEPIFSSYYHLDNDFDFDSLPYVRPLFNHKNHTENFQPNGEKNDNSLSNDNWKSCKRKGSPIKKINNNPNNVPDISPEFIKNKNETFNTVDKNN